MSTSTPGQFDPKAHPREGDGKFATKDLAEDANVDLASDLVLDPVPNERESDPLWNEVFLTEVPDGIKANPRGKGRFDIDGATSTESDGVTEGVTRMTMHFGGRPDLRSRNTAAAEIYADLEDRQRTRAIYDDLAANHKPVSLLMASSSGDIDVREGTLMTYQGQQVFLPKGSRVNGFVLNPDQVIGIEPGYGNSEGFAKTWHRRKAQHTPSVEPIRDFDDLPVYDGTEQEQVSAVYMQDHPGFGDGPGHGCLFLATDRQVDDNGQTEIVNGYFWTPDDAPLTSEHGSFSPAELKQRGGKISAYEPDSMTFSQCFDDMPSERSEAYRRVLGRSYSIEAPF